MKKTFYANESKGTVVCVINDAECDAIKLMRKVIGSTDSRGIIGLRADHSYLYCNDGISKDGAFRGIAKLHPSDTWSFEKGKELAFSRAYRKYLAAVNREINLVTEVLSDVVIALGDVVEDNLETIEDITNFLES